MAEPPANQITINRDETAPTGKPVSPVPPRFWWLKRIMLVSGALLVVLLSVRLWWGWEADRRLQAEIDRIIAAGEPIYPVDFDPEPMSPEENAAKLYLDAEAALNLTPAQSELVDNLYGKYSDIRRKMDKVGQIVQSNGELFQFMRRAGNLEEVDWGTQVGNQAISFMLPRLSAHRNMMRMLSIAAVYHGQARNDAESAATLLDALRFTEGIDREPMLIGHLVSLACRTRVSRDVEHLAPMLAVSHDTHERSLESRTAPRQLVFLLITELLDETGFQAALVRGMQTERMTMLSFAETILRGESRAGSVATGGLMVAPSWWGEALAFPLNPLHGLDALAGVRFYSAYVDAAAQPSWPTARAAMPTDPSDWSLFERWTRTSSGIALPSINRSALLHFRAMTEARMAAIALAIRLYEVDHGRRPEALLELVPEYLRGVPKDPLAATGRPFGYAPNAPKPILYSVGEDGKDDGGRYSIHPSGGVNRKSLDIPFFLDGDRPTRKRDAGESSERNDDGDNVESDRGDSEKNEPGQR